MGLRFRATNPARKGGVSLRCETRHTRRRNPSPQVNNPPPLSPTHPPSRINFHLLPVNLSLVFNNFGGRRQRLVSILLQPGLVKAVTNPIVYIRVSQLCIWLFLGIG
jgi:hypothetical protein